MHHALNTGGASVLFGLCLGMVLSAWASGPEPIMLDESYDHARYAPQSDIERKFAAFTLSFDSKDDDDGDDKPDLRRVPEWVAQHIKRTEKPCLDTPDYSGKWMTEQELFLSGVAPNDASYKDSKFNRGHMAARLLTARVSAEAAWNTHTVLNAVPQRGRFNQQIWSNLEALTGAWAQIYGEIWVMQGPVFGKGAAPFFIGDDGEREVAVPDALYKIVVREKTPEEKAQSQSAEKDDPEALVFLYPQLGPGYYGPKKEYRHERFLTTLKEIETLTGMTFFPTLDEATRERLRKTRAERLWSLTSPSDQPTFKLFVTGCRNRDSRSGQSAQALP